MATAVRSRTCHLHHPRESFSPSACRPHDRAERPRWRSSDPEDGGHECNEVIGVNSFGILGEPQAFNFLRPSSQLTELMAGAGVDNELSDTTQAYRDGLEAYWAGDKAAAVDALGSVVDEQPTNKLAADFLGKAEDLPDPPPPPADDSGLPVAAIAIGAAAVVLVGGGLAAFLLLRRRGTPAAPVTPPAPVAPVPAPPAAGPPPPQPAEPVPAPVGFTSGPVPAPVAPAAPTATALRHDPHFCGSCGEPAEAGKRFCSNCGAPLA